MVTSPLLWCLAATVFSPFSNHLLAQAVPVSIIAQGDGWALTRGGEPYVINGVGGRQQLELARSLGATTVRTWGIEELERVIDGKPFLDYAADLGLTVMVGLWIGHERHGFDYADETQIKRQREMVREAVRRYRDHPAVLVWGLGNEMEGWGDPALRGPIWRELEELARIIKAEDPLHPICTVIAGGDANKVADVIKYLPSIDILGVNAYGNAPSVGRTLVGAGWEKPFLLTEFGPLGHWEVGKAPWGAPIEPSSQAKAERYLHTHQAVMTDGLGRCLGTFAFVWGQKQETTGTWYGMFLKSGEKLPSVDAMAYAWSERWPSNRSPTISAFQSPARLMRVPAGEVFTASAEISDPEGDPLSSEWIVMAESTDIRIGGDRESEPPAFPELIRRVGETGADVATVEFAAPTTKGAYRLFLIVRDGQGGASADNFPFFVE